MIDYRVGESRTPTLFLSSLLMLYFRPFGDNITALADLQSLHKSWVLLIQLLKTLPGQMISGLATDPPGGP